MSADLLLHPGMTAVAIAEWCQRHNMFVILDFTTGPDGILIPLLQPRPQPDLEHVPAFLRRQAD